MCKELIWLCVGMFHFCKRSQAYWFASDLCDFKLNEHAANFNHLKKKTKDCLIIKKVLFISINSSHPVRMNLFWSLESGQAQNRFLWRPSSILRPLGGDRDNTTFFFFSKALIVKIALTKLWVKLTIGLTATIPLFWYPIL